MTKIRDSDVLGVLAFLQRLEIDRNNGRKRGRAYIDFLRTQFSVLSAQPISAGGSSLTPGSSFILGSSVPRSLLRPAPYRLDTGARSPSP